MEALLLFVAMIGSCALALGAARWALAALFAALTERNAGLRRAQHEKFSVAAGEAKLLAR